VLDAHEEPFRGTRWNLRAIKTFPYWMSQAKANLGKRQHPHADASYRVYGLDNGNFGVEVFIPEVLPTRVTSFPSRAAANRWIGNHKQAVERQSSPTRHLARFARAQERPVSH
jgi:hypothetical protein